MRDNNGLKGPKPLPLRTRKQDIILTSTVLCSILLSCCHLAAGDTFDHDAQHCHDVSIWGDVAFKNQDCQKCETEFEKVCETVVRSVCEQVPTTRCELIPFTDCEMYMEPATYQETVVIEDGEYVPWECRNETRLEVHTKLVPKCVNVTRQDCVTRWVVTATGEKVWDGNELCKPVQWQNCTLHEVPKEFNQTYTKCERTGMAIPTMKCELEERSRMTTGMRCEVKTAVNCTCTHSEQCATLTYQECKEIQKPLSCKTSSLRVPFQPKIHRVKCLLTSDRDAPELDVDESANEADQILETSQAKRKKRSPNLNLNEV